MSSRGITLIELIVALSIFALVVPVATSMLVSIMQNQRDLLTQQDILSQANYAVEYMSRAMRYAIKSSDTTCLSKAGENYELTSVDMCGVNGIKFINHTENDACQEFCLSAANGQLEERKNNTNTPLTPSGYIVKYFNIILSPASEPASGQQKYQPRVTFYLDLAQQGSASEEHVQTTISQRNLDI